MIVGLWDIHIFIPFIEVSTMKYGIRYELFSGNVTVCYGKYGPLIVDVPLRNGDFHSKRLVYQRVGKMG